MTQWITLAEIVYMCTTEIPIVHKSSLNCG